MSDLAQDERLLDIAIPVPADWKADASEHSARDAAKVKAAEAFIGFELELVDVFSSHTLVVDDGVHDLAESGQIAYSYRYLVRGTLR